MTIDETYRKVLLNSFDAATARLAEATKNEMSLEHGKPAAKMRAIARIIKAGDNALTGKPHSFSSAELLVEQDTKYSEYLADMRDAVENRILARGNYEASLIELQMEVNNR